ncbi:MAG TPA: hypothetical protein VKF59_08180 [Candidatus Dormibacteraeota bacterium]|nr:hypothetical protein [Candidatus Dormibacteraeota bacterium]
MEVSTNAALDDAERRTAFLAALNNHYFVLQSAAGNTITESAARASLYLVSLSISLVAIAFVAQSRSALGPFLAVVLPTLFVLGLFTIVRLVDTGVQNSVYVRAMAQIRRYYAGLTPEAGSFFDTGRDSPLAALLALASSRGRRNELFTIASMVAVINGVVGGAGTALLAAHLQGGFDRSPGVSLAAGGLTGLALLATFLVYQHRRYRLLGPLGSVGAVDPAGRADLAAQPESPPSP